MYTTLYLIFGAVFFAGAAAYWWVTKVFASDDGIYLPAADSQQEA